MYVLRCVKSGAFNHNLLVREGEFVTSLGGSTKNLNNAVTFDTKRETIWLRTDITNNGNIYIKRRPGKAILPARFEIVAVELSIKE